MALDRPIEPATIGRMQFYIFLREEVITLQREPLLITIEETMQVMKLGRTKIYALIRQEGLPVHRFGRRVLVDPDKLKSWLVLRREREAQ